MKISLCTQVIGARWKVKKVIGVGANGAVYEVQSVNSPRISGALKAESNLVVEGTLKQEVEVLKQLQSRDYTVRLMHSAKRETYSYMVMTLCGPDLDTLKQSKKLTNFSESTTLRVAILSLYAIKQLHEIGYVHRDIKASNIAVSVQDRHVLYLVDFGMARRYAVFSNKRWSIRQPRKKVFFRGTLRYCSANTHKRQEQGRVDDLWSLIYMLIDLRSNQLPWGKALREERILYLKETTSDKDLLIDGKMEFFEKILKHLRKLHYADRPDYRAIYRTMVVQIVKKRYRFHEPYDWEDGLECTTQEETSVNTTSNSSKTSSRRYSVHKLIPADIPLAQEEVFAESANDVPDISKIAYHISPRRKTHEGRMNSDETGANAKDVLP